MQATYNITNDTIFFKPSARLTDEQYAQAKQVNARWFPGRKVFAIKWSLRALEFLATMGIEENEIAEDDTPDDAAARVERFEKYAENAQESAARAADYADEANTQRRRELAARRATSEAERAAYWNERIQGAVGHARMKENTGVIARRVKEIEADTRKIQKEIEIHENLFKTWNNPEKELTHERALSIANYGRTPSIYYKLEKNEITPEQARATCTEFHALQISRGKKALAHYQMRLQYERALLDAMGGDPTAQAFEVGGAVVKTQYVYGSDEERTIYYEILKVNKTTVEIHDPARYWLKAGGYKEDKTKIKKVISRAEYEAIKNGQPNQEA